MEKMIGRYLLINCTAIARSIGETERQNAVLCITVDEGVAITDSAIVFFDCDADDFAEEEDFESYPASSDFSDLNTVLVEGKHMDEYIF